MADDTEGPVEVIDVPAGLTVRYLRECMLLNGIKGVAYIINGVARLHLDDQADLPKFEDAWEKFMDALCRPEA